MTAENVRCPYFHSFHQNGRGIICEGIQLDSENTTMFTNKAALIDHMNYNCCSEYFRGCPLADLIEYRRNNAEAIEKSKEKRLAKLAAAEELKRKKIEAEKRKSRRQAAKNRKKSRTRQPKPLP